MTAVSVLADESAFDAALAGDGPLLVELGATWCAPCRALEPILESVAEELAGRLRIGTVDVDRTPEVSTRYGVGSLPTLLLFEDGELQATVVGGRTKQQLLATVLPLLP
jgi:thioredoxin 1